MHWRFMSEPGNSEGMHVALADARPVAEFDAQLVAALRGAQEIVFVDAQHLVEDPDRRNRRFADTHGADLGRFDQRDGAGALEALRERCGGHPPGGAAPDDGNAGDAVGRAVHAQAV